MLRCRFAAFVRRVMTVLPSAIWTSLCLPGLHPAGVCATIWAAVLVVWTGIGSLLACDLGAVPLACYSASCDALAEGLFSGGGLLVGGGCGRIVGPFGPVRSSRVQSIRKKKALEMLALTGDFEKSARMSGISGRTLRRCL